MQVRIRLGTKQDAEGLRFGLAQSSPLPARAGLGWFRDNSGKRPEQVWEMSGAGSGRSETGLEQIREGLERSEIGPGQVRGRSGAGQEQVLNTAQLEGGFGKDLGQARDRRRNRSAEDLGQVWNKPGEGLGQVQGRSGTGSGQK